MTTETPMTTETEDIQGVFVVLREIPEIGAVVGDRILLRPGAPRPVLLQRELIHRDAGWAFGDRSELLFTRPDVLSGIALRRLRDAFPVGSRGVAIWQPTGQRGPGPRTGAPRLRLL